MSQTSSGFTSADHQEKATLGRLGKDYILTEDERRAFQECNRESFWYRCVPLSITSMAITQFLILRGSLTASKRFGSLPKVAFAGVCGYIAGNISYMKNCQEKFKRLEDSPLGEALRQRGRPLSPHSGTEQSEFLSEDKAMLQSDGHEGAFRSNNWSEHSALQSHLPAPGLANLGEEEGGWQKLPLSEEPQGRNRGKYEGFHRPPSETPPPKREVKKNIYGDTWDE
ncbi:OCIA domain-containing protein 1-like [Electrophorus electricus]|uniref:OCIA domain-containing protein 1 n=1 Tax=Electrophorus electricus TaxID=8005 RepID=A0AAY5ERW6_ELEEL|nr:OCIA domain-containing protein 1-like [Electrophorus electricus]